MLRHSIVGCVALILALGVMTNSTLADFEVGQSVEVQRGAEWQPATVTRKINGNYQVRYEAGGLVVVSPGRVRAAAGAAEAAGASGAEPGASESPASNATPRRESPMWRPRQEVEVKGGNRWESATIVRRQGEWWLVSYRGGNFGEWVEPWRIREVGSEEDNIGFVMPDKELTRNRRMPSPPNRPPGEPPVSAEARRAERRAALGDLGGAGEPGATSEELDAIRAGWAEAPEFPEQATAGPIPIDPARGEVPPRGSMSLGDAEIMQGEIVVARGAPIAVIAAGSGLSDVTLYRVDLAKRAMLDSANVGEHVKLADISADGSRAIFIADWFAEKSVRVWELGPKAASVARRVVAVDTFGKPEAPEWAAFSPDGGVLTFDDEGRLGLWDVESGKLTHQFKFDRRTRPNLSPGGRLLAGVRGGQVVIIDLQEKAVCGRLPAGRRASEIGFTPDGRRVFSGGFGEFSMHDLATGEQVSQGRAGTGRAVAFLDSEHFFTDPGRIMNLDGMAVVDYTRGPGAVAVGPRGVLLHASGGFARSEARLAWLAQPHADGIKAAAAWNPRDHVLIPAGARVAASVEGSFDVGNASEATAKLQATLAEAGYVIDPSSSIRFKGSVKKGETRKQRFEKRREFGVVHEVNVTPSEYSLVAEVNGNVVLRRSASTRANWTFQENPNLTLQQQVDEQTRSTTDWFARLKIPGEVLESYSPPHTKLPE